MEEYSNKRFGDALLDLIASNRISQAEAARRIGVKPPRMGILTLQRNADGETMERIARALGTNPAYFREYRAQILYDDYISGGDTTRSADVAKVIRKAVDRFR